MNKKHFLFFFVYFTLLFSTYSQNWQGILNELGGGQLYCLYADSVNDYLYMGGDFRTVNDDTIPGLVCWDGNQILPMGLGINYDGTYLSSGGLIMSIVRFNDEIYVGGFFQKIDNKPISFLARWDGQSWSSVGSGVNNGVFGLMVLNNELYVMGWFTYAGGITVNRIAKWSGTAWSNVFDFPQYSGTYAILCAALYKGQLYVGGSFDGLNGKQGLVKWNGTQWNDVGGGLYGSLGSVQNMLVYKDELYISGTFSKINSPSNPGNFIAKWDSTKWSDVGGGTECFGNGNITDMLVHGDKLFIVGDFCYAGGIPANHIAMWDGNQWCGFGSIIDNGTRSIAFYKDTLYIGGGFWTIDGDTINQIAKWTGGDYVDTCGVIIGQPRIHNPQPLISVSPNPFTNFTTLTIPDINKYSELEVIIYDIFGNEVKKQSLTPAFIGERVTAVINRNNLPQGIYFCKIINNNYLISVSKLIVH